MKTQLKNYTVILNNLKSKIRVAREQALLTVNTQLLSVYHEIGCIILQQQTESGWGSKVIETLAKDLRSEFPDMTGLSVRNLKYMRAFAESWA